MKDLENHICNARVLPDLGQPEELGFCGPLYTWSNKRRGIANIKERIDRGLANIQWKEIFPESKVSHIPCPSSDHCPILLDTNPAVFNVGRQFHFQPMWLSDPSCSTLITEAWKKKIDGSHDAQVTIKLRYVKVALKRRNKENFGNVLEEIKSLKSQLYDLMGQTDSDDKSEREAALKSRWEELLRREEILWRVKSRELWLKEGDRNTRFFHLSTINKRRKNQIEWIKKKEDGAWVFKREEVSAVLLNHLKEVFETKGGVGISEAGSLLEAVITEEDNVMLKAPPTKEEVQQAVFQIGANKAPGPDGFSSIFFHSFWHAIGDDIFF